MFQSWSVQVGRNYQIQVEIYDKDSNRIHPSDNLVIELELEEPSYLDLTDSLANGTLHTATPRKAGHTGITARLLGVRVSGVLQRLAGPPVTATATLEIYEALSVLPPFTALPWNPAAGAAYPQQFEVRGGLAPFSWSTSNGTLAALTQTGAASLHTGRVGQAQVTAAMTRSVHNRATAEVYVLPADRLKLRESELEFQVGTELTLPLGLYYAQGMEPFSRCHLLPFDLQLSDEGQVFEAAVLESAGNAGCADVGLTASKVSYTKLTAELRMPSPGGDTAVVLTDTVTVATFLPLAPLSPASGETVLAVESSRHGDRQPSSEICPCI